MSLTLLASFLRLPRLWPLFLMRFVVCAFTAVMSVGLVPSIAVAQVDPRSVFPGRRVAGGTRGDCAARILAHLVPPSSVYAPGSAALLGLLQGPAETPTSVDIKFLSASGQLVACFPSA